MVFDGSLLRDLLVQTPVIASLLIFIVMDRRDHKQTVDSMRAEIRKLQAALIDHMNRLNE